MVLKKGDIVEYITNPSIFGIIYNIADELVYVRYIYKNNSLHHHSAAYENFKNFLVYWNKVNE